MDFKRVLIEKREEYNVEAKKLMDISKDYLGLKQVKNIRVINLYDIIGGSEEDLEKIILGVLYEPTVDFIYFEEPEISEQEKAFRV